jgi:ABC-type transport system substrate-binding protein
MPTIAPRPSETLTPAATVAPPPILGDARVRQAIVHCANRTELIQSVYPWITDTAPLMMDSFLPRDHWAYPVDDSALARYPFDPAYRVT